MARKKRIKKLSLIEFQAWLEGVEELQPADWSPNSEQWQLIREKIRSITIEVENAVTAPQLVHREVQPMATPAIVPPPPVGGIPIADIDMTPEARRMLQGDPTPQPNAKVHDDGGPYTSTFS